jgi:hypothetical protein
MAREGFNQTFDLDVETNLQDKAMHTYRKSK